MWALCERCLADDPADRPANAGVVRGCSRKAQGSPRGRCFDPRHASALWTGAAAMCSRRRTGRRGWPLPRVSRVSRGASRFAATLSWSPRAGQRTGRRAQQLITTVPRAVHCFSMLGRQSGRAWCGAFRDVPKMSILLTGKRLPAEFVPRTYRAGCPQLSPRHDRLLFSAPTADGRERDPIVQRARRSRGPWLSRPASSLYGCGTGKSSCTASTPITPAIFSLPTMGFDLVARSWAGRPSDSK